MKLTQEERMFIKANKRTLKSLYDKRKEDILNQTLSLPPGQERDILLGIYKEADFWLLLPLLLESKPHKKDTGI